ncbi:xanthine dehydrogenase family protein molybdopterin-binding subunit [Flavihumibacter sp. RY-1]|uniref:Xanthine dehydrogenase family protein molybdopterin-binding subunit n=1 Tax=Flavihumibacter fluminis TaxID=2909236 RepID=A0ABS9BMB7_9BACT|nr:xanthine dehydrogenase family protein molybdopterin-binding subunit [Flavihumibacter fluminis]MCF1716780.1 xanthine dehydrogenase family protein molybdopterin-binding subunit [Flavihumibacter fluminis]
MRTTLSRRRFLRLSSFTGAGLIIGLNGVDGKAFGQLVNLSNDAELVGVTPFVLIDPKGGITIYNTKPELGQGTFQSIPSLIAEELDLTLDLVTIRQSGGQIELGADQFSGGSASIRTSYTKYRKVGAAAREMLVTAASQAWGVPAQECITENGKVLHKASNRSATYQELAATAAKLEVPKEPKLKDPSKFILLGKRVKRPDIPLKSNGTAVFGIDVEVPGMLYASIERCPVFGGKLISFDDSATKKVKGVQQVITCERLIGKYRFEGVAVLADNYWAAVQGRKALKVKWDYQGYDKFSLTAYEQQLRELAKSEGVVDHTKGDFDKAYAAAPTKLEAFYETPMVSHSPMEPMNCLAHWKENNQIEIWTSTQVPFSIKNSFSKEYKVKPEDITVHVQFNGGGFGRRLYPDYVHEAVQLSKKAGKPVKAIWTREDDTQQGPFRPMTFSAFKGALDANKKPVAFQHKVISPSIGAATNPNYDKTKTDGGMTEGISEQAYEIPNMKNLYVHADMHVPLAAWRAVTSTTLAFSHESFLDEMAVKAGADPMAFRLSMLDSKHSDTKRLLEKLKEVSNWDKPLPAGWGRGVAQWEFFAGLAGNVVEVSKKGDGIKIEKVYAVIDLGTMVNPDMVEAQVEGAIVMAITAAIKNGIRIENGKTIQSNFHNNPILKITETPPIEVFILAEGGEKIKGVGEPGLPPLAPALCNAIFAATGKRIRRLPFDINKI